MIPRSQPVLALALMAMTLQGCRVGAESPPDAMQQLRAAQSAGAGQPSSAPDAEATDGTETSPQAGSGPAAGGGARGPVPGPNAYGSEPSTSPSPMPSPDMHAVQVTASLVPTCVRPGQAMALDVVTEPGASAGYQAMYAGEEGGGPPPFGAGHGGNNGGQADAAGHYRDRWIVSAGAPTGDARVDIVVAYEGEFGSITLDFVVIDALTGTCP